MNPVKFFSRRGSAKRLLEAIEKKGLDYLPSLKTLARLIKRAGNFKNIKEERWVDIGCGEGIALTEILKFLKFEKVIAIDASKEMIRFVEQKVRPQISEVALKALCLNMESAKLPLSNKSVLLVTSLLTVPYISNIQNLFSEASRVLKSGGIFCFNLYIFESRRISIKSGKNSPDYLIHSEKELLQYAARFNFEIEDHTRSSPCIEFHGKISENLMFLRKK